MASEDGPLLEEFRNAFQEVSQWIDSAEAKLLESRKSEERALGREIEEWRPKFGNLRSMAEKLVQIFVGQKNDVEPEMKNLGQRFVYLLVLLYVVIHCQCNQMAGLFFNLGRIQRSKCTQWQFFAKVDSKYSQILNKAFKFPNTFEILPKFYLKVSKSFIFLAKSLLGTFYRHLAIFSGHSDHMATIKKLKIEKLFV